MTIRQGYTFAYTLLVEQSGSVKQAQENLANWQDKVKEQEREWRVATDPEWSETPEAQADLQEVLGAFGAPAPRREPKESKE